MFKKLLAFSGAALMVAVAVPVFAQTSGSTGGSAVATKIACVGAAVNTREQSLGTAMTTFTAALNAAYAARAAALQQAYAATSTASVKVAVKAAWSAFGESAKTVRKAWQTARNAAWSTYRAAAAACRAPSGVGDGSFSGAESSGN